MKIDKIRRFDKKNFGLFEKFQQVPDNRKRPAIPMSTILQGGMDMSLLGFSSMLELDQHNRTLPFKYLYGSEREMVFSDSTMARMLEQVPRKMMRDMLYHCYGIVERKDWNQTILPSGRSVKVGIVDGSGLGQLMTSVLVVSGAANWVVDFEVMEGRGHELNASRRLLARALSQLGQGFVSHLLYDGLMMVQDDFEYCLNTLGCHLVVKTREKGLNLITEAREIFSREDPAIEVVKGTDLERNFEYEIKTTGGFKWNKLPFNFKVAQVEVKHLKPSAKKRSEDELFWVVTTDESLGAQDMRSLAHQRWQIENNVFKEMNGLVGTKNRYIRNENTKWCLLCLWFLGFNLRQASQVFMGWFKKSRNSKTKKIFSTMKSTQKFLSKMLLIDLVTTAAVLG